MVKHRDRVHVRDLFRVEPRDHLFREIQRVARIVAHGGCAADHAVLAVLDEIPIGFAVAADDRRRHHRVRIALHLVDQRLHEPRRGERRIALQVDDQVRIQPAVRHRIGTARRAVLAVARGHDDLGPEPLGRILDPRVIGGDIDRIHAGHRTGGFPRHLDQRLVASVRLTDRDQRLARIAGGGIAGRDQNDGLHWTPKRKRSWRWTIPMGLPSASTTKRAETACSSIFDSA